MAREVVAVIGTGVIGTSWAAHFLAQGFDVIAADPAPGAEARLRADVARLLAEIAAYGPQPGAAGELAFTADPVAAAAGADFIQENGPERVELKQALLGALAAAAAPDTIIASSTSGLEPALLQQGCPDPGRVIVGHPVNPPHVLPLVELVGGPATDPAVMERAIAFYRRAGKKPIPLRRAVKGHIVNRLQAALWQEMIHLVATGVASAADVDKAMLEAIGPRWAARGPFVNLHLSGGEAGLRGVLERLGPAMADWWADLGRVDLTPEVIDRVVASTEALLAAEDQATLAARRDAAVVALLQARNGP